ncbi:prepilin-type N-terminal cleavage/methylation domain-containing protein [Candidatus Daviesbacteria bacterium]|nr:prepilin-type N-terminal cleavage/methylation domain-containing protein [Candidatus Daviesbacteria bacterium]
MPKRKGFTLIELMVAIAIVAIISSIGYISYASAQVTGRDSRRKQDLRSIASALEIYKQQIRHYPCTGDWQVSNDDTSTFWLTNVSNSDNAACGVASESFDTNYIKNLPIDPLSNSSSANDIINGKSGAHGYTYYSASAPDCPNSPPGTYFYLVTALENPNDGQRNELQPANWCDGTPTKFANNTYVVTNP